MISGDPSLRTYDEVGAVSHMCLDFNGTPVESKGLPLTKCPSGVRSQIVRDVPPIPDSIIFLNHAL